MGVRHGRMKHFTQVLLAVFWHLGGGGLLLLGILDSSFLFAPLGNDLLVVAMTARYRSVGRMFYFAAMSTAGSVLGCLLVDVILRRAGGKELEHYLPRKRIQYVNGKVENNAAWALIVASIAPPPFPFTPFIMAAAALQYPRARLLTVTGLRAWCDSPFWARWRCCLDAASCVGRRAERCRFRCWA